MVLQRRLDTVMYQGREMDVYDLRESADGPLVHHSETDFFDKLGDSQAYKESRAARIRYPIRQRTLDGAGGFTFYLLTPHGYHDAQDVIVLPVA
jgi:hypothetical protein